MKFFILAISIVFSQRLLATMPDVLTLPTPAEFSEIAKRETKKSLELLYNNIDLSDSLKKRAIELVPKNAATLTSFHGVTFQIIAGSLTKINSDGTKEIIIDSAFIPVGASISDFTISPDGEKIAYGFSYFGSSWQIWRIFNVNLEKNEELDGDFVVKNFGNKPISWMPDSKRILYQRSASFKQDYVGLRSSAILMHRLGTDRKNDQLLFKNYDNPETSHWASLAIDNDNVVIFRVQGVALMPMSILHHQLSTKTIKHLIEPNKFLAGTAGNIFSGIKNKKIFIRSQEAGDKYGILKIDLTNPSIPKKTIIVPQMANATLNQSMLIGDKLLNYYILDDLSSEFRLHDLNGNLVNKMKPSDLGLTNYGSTGLPFINSDDTSQFAYFNYSSVDLPTTTIKIDVIKNQFTHIQDTAVVPFNTKNISRELVSYKSFDGKPIKMFIYSRKDLKVAPKFIYLFSYGFIGIPNLPQYNRKFQLALEMGGVVALPALRGGGEFGAKFQLEGTNDRLKTLNDLVFASRWLKNNLTVKNLKVVVVGRSFGGLAVASHYVNNQNEFDLFSSIVPITDVSYSLMSNSWWAPDDHGILRDQVSGKIVPNAYEELFARLKVWNPMDNINKLKKFNNLKPVIIFPGEFDVNTTPEQSVRFFDQLTSNFPDQRIHLIQHQGGHGARAELVDEFMFISKYLNLKGISINN